MSGEASSHGIMNQGFITSLRLNEYHKSQLSMPFLRLFSSPETEDNLREISGDRNGDQI